MSQSVLLGKSIPEIIKTETLPELLAPSFMTYKDQTAFIFKDRRLTYAELDSWSNAIAADLQNRGVKAGDRVGVWYPRSMELPVAILGIIKAGAAYVPLDREMPLERIQKVFGDIQVKTYFSDEDAGIHCPPIPVPANPEERVPPVLCEAGAQNWAYVLFTSGSTGAPKGIPVAHHNICHLVRSEQDTIQIRSSDTVYQGFSVSFDMWCEEVWISLFAGATVWIADAVTVKALDELSSVLTENHITVLHAVPSVLAIIDEVPALRLVNSGGEACTQPVLQKWGTPYRIFINSYGPTETTVSSNMAFIKAGDEISIGDPLPNYNVAVVDENMQIVPRGERGEMILTGPGVTEGYFNLPELTAQKFLSNPFPELPGDTLYKTGDAVVIREDGFIEFHGRFDDQIKLRGYRIELGEIESRLNGIEGVSAAAVTLKQDANGQDQLVGYVVWSGVHAFNENEIRHQLATFLAPYMVPVTIVSIADMPRMPSGKINRKQLPQPESFLKKNDAADAPVFDKNGSVEEHLLKVLQLVFPGKEINLQQDFFTDLGGHSLLAATVVSSLRRDAGLLHASLKDIYEHRPLQSFAGCLAEKQEAGTTPKEQPFHRVSTAQYYLCNVLQTVCLLFVYGLLAIEVIFPYLSYYYFLANGDSYLKALSSAVFLYILIPPTLALTAIVLKWIVIGKIKEGDYPLWGWYYFRWWLWKALKRLLPSQYIVDTPLYPRYLRLLGVKVHPTAQLSFLPIAAEDLVSIGKNVSTSSGCAIDNAVVENGLLRLRQVRIGDHAYLGSSSIVCGNTVIEKNGELRELSCLREGERIGENEIWNGSPAKKEAVINDNASVGIKPAPAAKRNRYAFVYLCSLFIFPLIVVIPLFPTLYTLYVADYNADDYDFSYLWQTPLLAASYLLIFIFCVAGISRVLQWKMKEGQYSIFSFTYYRKWVKDQLMNMSLIVLHPLYASVYISWFYRLLGAKVGRNSEISTASDVSHHLLEIGNGSFIADAVILGEHDVKNEVLTLEKTVIGNNSFVGNSGLIPQGYHLKDNTLVGVLSKAPDEKEWAANKNADWFGSPPIALPARQKMEGFEDKLTYHPSAGLKIARAVVEGIRIILPQTCVIIASVLLIAYAHNLLLVSVGRLLLFIPFYYLFFMGIPLFLVAVLLKWIFVGKYKKAAMPMYSVKVWLSEAITSFHEALSVPFLLDPLRGTMWLPLLLRLLGVKTGKKVWLNTTDITEFDMVTIGDEAMLNEDCGPQTHLFEDRIMKVGTVNIGSRSTIGTRSIVLYDSVVGSHVTVDSLSLIMKGEQLPDNTAWGGSPVRPI
ncbi:Pls/PosA family non-ribosomal peptide synthetase [Niabella sp.]|uniref:Pls/PosA family non-ribosomal peptide synthetase n=1 Tax=Niabella sp. TaxID=1962976 RepID=UPI00261124FD|nr:Pls/PosA family non-ribosomal peptide synthetase [Niabella sp.]